MVTVKHLDGVWTGLCQAVALNWQVGTATVTVDVTDPAGTVSTETVNLTGTVASQLLVSVDTVDCRAQTFRDALVLACVYDGSLPVLAPPFTIETDA
jgi:hypothetical protein